MYGLCIGVIFFLYWGFRLWLDFRNMGSEINIQKENRLHRQEISEKLKLQIHGKEHQAQTGQTETGS
jgi:preprotein translocase subunit SecF